MSQLPKVSVVVPVRNGGELLSRAVRSVLAQDYPRERTEILVVDNGSTDDSADRAKRLGVLLLVENRPGASHARNRGLESATGDVVAFADADCEVKADWLTRLVEALASADAVMGRIEPFPGGNRFARARAALHELFLQECIRLDHEDRLDRFDTANAAAWRHVLVAAGGFNPQVLYVEDRELGARIAERGGRVKFTAAALALHHYEQRLLASMRKAEGTGRIWAKFPDLFSMDVLRRHFADVLKLLAAAPAFSSPLRHRLLRARFWLHVTAATVRPGFDNCLRHFRAAERLAMLHGIVSAADGRQTRSPQP